MKFSETILAIISGHKCFRVSFVTRDVIFHIGQMFYLSASVVEEFWDAAIIRVGERDTRCHSTQRVR